MSYREATLTDIFQLQRIRNAVKENILSTPDLVTDKDYEPFLTHQGKGWVCEINQKIVGFAIADLKNKNIWALFVDPLFEKKGIGKQLHQLMMDWYFLHEDKVWLSTAPHTRAAQFYKKAGWILTGMHGTKELKFEMTSRDWKKQ